MGYAKPEYDIDERRLMISYDKALAVIVENKKRENRV